MMNVFLLGLPGSGKSTLGKQLAEILGLPFVDLDEEIQKDQAQSIKQIMDKGEPHFRTVEHQVLLRVLNQHPGYVMACGGGTPCYYDHMTLLKNEGKTIFLDIPILELVKRIEANDVERPLLDPSDLANSLESLLIKRKEIYLQADLMIQGVEIDVKQIIDLLPRN